MLGFRSGRFWISEFCGYGSIFVGFRISSSRLDELDGIWQFEGKVGFGFCGGKILGGESHRKFQSFTKDGVDGKFEFRFGSSQKFELIELSQIFELLLVISVGFERPPERNCQKRKIAVQKM